MAYKMKGFSGFGNSPAKQKGRKNWENYGKGEGADIVKKSGLGPRETPGYTDLETTDPGQLAEHKREYKYGKDAAKTGSRFTKHKVKKAQDTLKKKSPAKQEGPISKENIKLQKGEMEGTWIYPGSDKSERITDYEDRAEFAKHDAESATTDKEKKQHLANVKKLQHEADIIRNRKPNKK